MERTVPAPHEDLGAAAVSYRALGGVLGTFLLLLLKELLLRRSRVVSALCRLLLHDCSPMLLWLLCGSCGEQLSTWVELSREF